MLLIGSTSGLAFSSLNHYNCVVSKMFVWSPALCLQDIPCCMSYAFFFLLLDVRTVCSMVEQWEEWYLLKPFPYREGLFARMISDSSPSLQDAVVLWRNQVLLEGFIPLCLLPLHRECAGKASRQTEMFLFSHTKRKR